MRVRALDVNHDWTFGKGQNDYLVGNRAIGQLIQTRLLEFSGNCFWNLGAGLDWFNYLGSKDEITTNLAIRSTILNTDGVTGLIQVSINLSPVTRKLTVQYKVQTIYSVLTGAFVYDLNGTV
jgi:hypothetical protein